jgi:hypothetical protein
MLKIVNCLNTEYKRQHLVIGLRNFLINKDTLKMTLIYLHNSRLVGEINKKSWFNFYPYSSPTNIEKYDKFDSYSVGATICRMIFSLRPPAKGETYKCDDTNGNPFGLRDSFIKLLQNKMLNYLVAENEKERKHVSEFVDMFDYNK